MDMSLDLHRTIPQAVTHAAPHIKHVAVMAAPVIKSGVSMLTIFISSTVSSAIGFGLGWYIKGRGMTGVKIDLANIKNDIVSIQAKLSAPAVTA